MLLHSSFRFKEFFFGRIYFLFILLPGCSIQSHFIQNSINSVATVDSITQSIFLIGDAGEPVSDRKEPTFQILTKDASVFPERNTIIFLGDNIYPSGLPEVNSANREEMERRLNEQIFIGSESGARTIFIPGNHDWNYGGRDGLASVIRQGAFITSKNNPHITMLPANGFPGPSVIDCNGNVRIIAIDTEWWLQAFQKPFYIGDTSEAQTKIRFLDSLSYVLSVSQNKIVIVAGHHPLRSYGEHGGFFDWKDHVFPLRKISPWLWIPIPVIGSLYPLSRMAGISEQDMSGSKNSEMRKAIDSVISRYPVTAYASGHEHAMQVIDKESHHYYLVSGKGIQHHTEALTYGESTIAATRHEGFMRLDILSNGTLRLSIISAERNRGVEVFSMILY